uniref:Exportin-2 C-terminal domain-containing protein n=1 Tax=Piliocolobus tephrosceles TaxID=591936 RepID=A0A8C9LLZ9_9PRIM
MALKIIRKIIKKYENNDYATKYDVKIILTHIEFPLTLYYIYLFNKFTEYSKFMYIQLGIQNMCSVSNNAYTNFLSTDFTSGMPVSAGDVVASITPNTTTPVNIHNVNKNNNNLNKHTKEEISMCLFTHNEILKNMYIFLKIFYNLLLVDLPEYFEDNLDIFFVTFFNLLLYNNKYLNDQYFNLINLEKDTQKGGSSNILNNTNNNNNNNARLEGNAAFNQQQSLSPLSVISTGVSGNMTTNMNNTNNKIRQMLCTNTGLLCLKKEYEHNLIKCKIIIIKIVKLIAEKFQEESKFYIIKLIFALTHILFTENNKTLLCHNYNCLTATIKLIFHMNLTSYNSNPYKDKTYITKLIERVLKHIIFKRTDIDDIIEADLDAFRNDLNNVNAFSIRSSAIQFLKTLCMHYFDIVYPLLEIRVMSKDVIVDDSINTLNTNNTVPSSANVSSANVNIANANIANANIASANIASANIANANIANANNTNDSGLTSSKNVNINALTVTTYDLSSIPIYNYNTDNNTNIDDGKKNLTITNQDLLYDACNLEYRVQLVMCLNQVNLASNFYENNLKGIIRQFILTMKQKYPNVEYVYCNLNNCFGGNNINNTNESIKDLNTTGLNTTGLNTTGLNTTGLNTTGLNTTGLNTTGLNTTGLNTTGLNTTGLNTTGLNTTGLNTTGLNTTDLNTTGLNTTGLNTTGLNINKYQFSTTTNQVWISDEQLFNTNNIIYLLSTLKFLLNNRTICVATYESIDCVFDFLRLLLYSEKAMVHNYAYLCINRILNQPLNKDILTNLYNNLIGNIFDRLLFLFKYSVYNKVYNEYILITILRILLVFQTNIVLTTTKSYIVSLLFLIDETIKQSIYDCHNPIFNHYLFEILTIAINLIFQTENRQGIMFIETVLIKTFSLILKLSTHDYIPYIFQILSIIIDRSEEIKNIYVEILTSLYDQDLWKSSIGNANGIVCVLKSFFKKYYFFQNIIKNNMQQLFTIFHYCLSNKKLTSESFQIILIIFTYLPIDSYVSFLKQLLVVLFSYAQQYKSDIAKIKTVHALSVFILKNDVSVFVNTVEQINTSNFQRRVMTVVLFFFFFMLLF